MTNDALLTLFMAGMAAFAVGMYVVLDGFDLGLGILFPFADDHGQRDQMMNSIAPFWDGNETWLVFGGAILLSAFPLAFSVIMPAVYLPVIVMLLGLIFRGVAFEFRFKHHPRTRIWDLAFCGGSVIATFAQGVVLGTFVQGIRVEGGRYAGGPWDWLTAFSVMTAVALLCGYALLGNTWLFWRSRGALQGKGARLDAGATGRLALRYRGSQRVDVSDVCRHRCTLVRLSPITGIRAGTAADGVVRVERLPCREAGTEHTAVLVLRELVLPQLLRARDQHLSAPATAFAELVRRRGVAGIAALPVARPARAGAADPRPHLVQLPGVPCAGRRRRGLRARMRPTSSADAASASTAAPSVGPRDAGLMARASGSARSRPG